LKKTPQHAHSARTQANNGRSAPVASTYTRDATSWQPTAGRCTSTDVASDAVSAAQSRLRALGQLKAAPCSDDGRDGVGHSASQAGAIGCASCAAETRFSAAAVARVHGDVQRRSYDPSAAAGRESREVHDA
jgi:hypothetical protein